MYEYRAQLIRVIDGDTIEATVDLGFEVAVRRTFRLDSINAPELHAKDPAVRAKAKAARDRLVALLGTGEMTIRSIRDRQEKYGRYLAVILLADGTTANDVLVKEHLAEPYLP